MTVSFALDCELLLHTGNNGTEAPCLFKRYHTVRARELRIVFSQIDLHVSCESHQPALREVAAMVCCVYTLHLSSLKCIINSLCDSLMFDMSAFLQ